MTRISPFRTHSGDSVDFRNQTGLKHKQSASQGLKTRHQLNASSKITSQLVVKVAADSVIQHITPLKVMLYGIFQ